MYISKLIHIFNVLNINSDKHENVNSLKYDIIDEKKPVKTSNLQSLDPVDTKYLSVSLDSHIIGERWKNFDFKSEKLKNLAKGLAPAYLRLGGTAADLVTFVPDKPELEKLDVTETHKWCANSKNGSKADEDLDELYKQLNKFNMSGEDLINIYNFSKEVGWTLLFDINVLKRLPDGSWDKSNAQQLLDFASANNLTGIVWQLGNEPNSFRHEFNITISGSQLGQDFLRLKELLQSYPLYNNSLLVGPDINQVGRCTHLVNCAPLQYLDDVNQNSNSILDALTWHHYYVDGAKATLQQFLDPRMLDSLQDLYITIQNFSEFRKIDKPFWLGETSSAWSGGADGLSNTFVGGYNWIDKLGMSALYKHKVLIRQTFYHGCYSLLDENLDPKPDYWISLLYKKLVGLVPIDIGFQNRGKKCRLYIHQSTDERTVTVFGLNMDQNKTAEVVLSTYHDYTYDSYILTPKDGNIQSTEIMLNGQLLQLEKGQLPIMKPHTAKGKKLQIPSSSIVFFVFGYENPRDLPFLSDFK